VETRPRRGVTSNCILANEEPAKYIMSLTKPSSVEGSLSSVYQTRDAERRRAAWATRRSASCWSPAGRAPPRCGHRHLHAVGVVISTLTGLAWAPEHVVAHKGVQRVKVRVVVRCVATYIGIAAVQGGLVGCARARGVVRSWLWANPNP
jgi:hypothetical protein